MKSVAKIKFAIKFKLWYNEINKSKNHLKPKERKMTAITAGRPYFVLSVDEADRKKRREQNRLLHNHPRYKTKYPYRQQAALAKNLIQKDLGIKVLVDEASDLYL